MPPTVRPRAVLSALARGAQTLAHSNDKPLIALGALIDALPLAALVAEDHGHYVLANVLATRLTGYSTRELRRLSVWDLTPGSAKDDFEVLWRVFIERREQWGDYQLVTKSGRVIVAEYAARANVLPHLHVSVLRVTAAKTLNGSDSTEQLRSNRRKAIN
jgi:PAS domain S-box-containing protein